MRQKMHHSYGDCLQDIIDYCDALEDRGCRNVTLNYMESSREVTYYESED